MKSVSALDWLSLIRLTLYLADSASEEEDDEEDDTDQEESVESGAELETVLDARFHAGEKYGNLRGLHETTVKNLTTILVNEKVVKRF